MTFESKVVWENELDNIKEKGALGTTMSELARHYGVSRQRMKQVVDRYIPNWGDAYGQSVKRSEKAQKWHSKWGEKEDSLLYVLKREKFRRKKYNAERTGYTWDITFGELEWPTHCPILGMELDYQAEVVKENSVSFDRIDSSLGYVSGNVIIISWRANRIKNNGTAEEHRKIADYLDSL